MIFFKEKFWEFPQYFQISSKISNFQRKILRISKDFIEIFFKFSLNFHSIFKRNFWFCEIHLKIERNWEKKKITKIYRSFDGRVEKSNFGKFWLFLEFFGKLTWFFDNFPFYNNFEITGTIYSNSESLEQFLVTECFFNLFLKISQISKNRTIIIQIGKTYWDLEICRKS